MLGSVKLMEKSVSICKGLEPGQKIDLGQRITSTGLILGIDEVIRVKSGYLMSVRYLDCGYARAWAYVSSEQLENAFELKPLTDGERQAYLSE